MSTRREDSTSDGVPVIANPTMIPNARVWLRADRGVTLNAGAVETWANQADTVLLPDVTQAVAANRPTFRAVGINGLPDLDFDGANDVLTRAMALVAQPWHWFCVTRYDTFAGADDTMFSGSAVNSNLIQVLGTRALNLYAGLGVTSGAAQVADGEVLIPEGEVNGAGSRLLKNGTVLATGNAGAQGMDAMTIGNFAGVQPYDGKIAEVIGYSRILTAAESLAIRRYLGARYGVPIV